MKFINVTLALILGIFSATIYPELLIVRKVNDRFMSLLTAMITDSDSQKIMDIILKYEWPMCIAQDLNPQEQNALLTPDKPFAEELFIQNKIQEVVGDQYWVIFVPTAIYELYVMLFESRHVGDDSLGAALKRMDALSEEEKYTLDLFDALAASNNPATVLAHVFDVFKRVNTIFFNEADGKKSTAWYINVMLGMHLFLHYPELAQSSNALELSNAIKNKSGAIITRLREELIKDYQPHLAFAVAQYNKEVVKDALANEPQTNIIGKVVQLEYEARELNKGLLLRGTSFVNLPVGFGKQAKAKLAGSTLIGDYTFIRDYAEKTLAPHSISFGNSLFAGMMRDPGASVYIHLGGPSDAVGYALLINKKAYVKTQNNDLFFIAPLAPLVALFSEGEFFHSRTKVAVPSKNIKSTVWGGLTKLSQTLEQIDPTGVLLIERDPLIQAELFSKFLANNGRIIQEGNMDGMTEEEKNFAQQVMQSQRKAAQFYKATRTIVPTLQRWIKKYRQKKEAEKSTALSELQEKEELEEKLEE